MRIKLINVKRPTNFSCLLVACLLIVAVIILLFHRYSIFRPLEKNFSPSEISEHGSRPDFKVMLDPWNKIDGHDEPFVQMERERKGNGEQGKPATLPSNYNETKFDEAFRMNGFNGLLSDYISINRSAPDFRHMDCRKMKYRQYLPDVSIILPISNNQWSTLLRTVYSILNRSPSELIKEIILVNDNSKESQINEEQLDDFVASNSHKIRVLHIGPSSQTGIIMARLLGARNASGQILIFLDTQTEVGINWLPPLLEPFVENYRLCVCPIVDVIDRETFEIGATFTSVGRDGFDWSLDYKHFPLLPKDEMNPTVPYKNPVMFDSLFAITSRFFWEIGGYDTGLQEWGGEQYELSFKIWQCGGTLLKAPCSRVAHLPYGEYEWFANPRFGELIGRNYKRIAEVWMDEYAEYLYLRKPEYRTLDPGNLSQQRAIRKQLECKPFKWYMDEIAFDVVKKYPPKEPPAYGWGKIRPIANDELCLTVLAVDGDECVELKNCLSTTDDEVGQRWQEFLLSWHKDIEIRGTEKCLDGVKNFYMAPITVYPCHKKMGNQLWKYNLETQQFMFGRGCERCLTADVQRIKVFLENCKKNSKNQKWMIDSINREALKLWNRTSPLVV